MARPVDSKTTEFGLPLIPRVYDSPHSSVTSTPVEGNSPVLGHRRTDSVRGIEGEDYFASLPKPVISDSKNSVGTPHSVTKYSVTFSPRIQFHDTWPSGEYDRRGDIATCNRLTPMLAQQIKEELNTFKMVLYPSTCLSTPALPPYLSPLDHSWAVLTLWPGNGGPRAIKGLHAFLLRCRGLDNMPSLALSHGYRGGFDAQLLVSGVLWRRI